MIFKRLTEEIDSIINRDPAAGSRVEVILCYPGFHAVLAYRLTHVLWLWKIKLLSRFLAYLAKVMTGVEIHPGATIGRRLFIDHATGVVIGQTAEIADDVTLYQGVTLGGTSLHRGKRHPTLENGVIVGAGAQVLGPITIGAGARIGANAVVVTNVAPGATMVGIPARVVLRNKAGIDPDFCAYGTPEDVTDPMVRALSGLREQLSSAMERIEEMERRLEDVAVQENAGSHALKDQESLKDQGFGPSTPNMTGSEFREA